jgi:hypothetical protein
VSRLPLAAHRGHRTRTQHDQGAAESKPAGMKGTFTPSVRVKVPFMRLLGKDALVEKPLGHEIANRLEMTLIEAFAKLEVHSGDT